MTIKIRIRDCFVIADVTVKPQLTMLLFVALKQPQGTYSVFNKSLSTNLMCWAGQDRWQHKKAGGAAEGVPQA